MNLRKKLITITVSAFAIFICDPSLAFGEDKSVKGEMKQSGSEFKKAGTSLGKDIKRGKVVRGGKSFGIHTAKGGKYIGKGTAKAATKTGSAIKKAVTP